MKSHLFPAGVVKINGVESTIRHFWVTLGSETLNYPGVGRRFNRVAAPVRQYLLEIVQVVLCLVFFWLSFFVNGRLDAPYPGWAVSLIISFAVLAIYAIAYLLYWWPARHRQMRVWATIGLYPVFAGAAYVLAYILLPSRQVYLFDPAIPFHPGDFILNMAQFYITFFFAAVSVLTLYWARDYIRKERKWKSELQRYELQFAMAQISPHGIYNSFNSLHAILDKENPGLTPILTNIIEAMRYNTAQAGRYEGVVPLQQEIEQLQRLNALYRFRYKDRLFLEIRVDLDPADYEIIPISVSTLLENAMRYGVSHDPRYPVAIRFATDSQHLVVTCHNKIKDKGLVEPSTGIGQPNLRDRLLLVYGREAALDIEEGNAFYKAAIRIPLGKVRMPFDKKKDRL